MRKQGQVDKRLGANLPHWTREGATYAVTFRLADSLPQPIVERLKRELDQVERQYGRGAESLSLEQLVQRSKAKSEAYQSLLDEGHGECLLKRDDIAEIVAGALLHFKDKRYRLYAWCVMPNHVHVVLEPIDSNSLSSILHSWKSYTATMINRKLSRSGGLWQRESYDHLVRDHADFAHQVAYVRENPAKAGLRSWAWVS